jgi:mitochondrial GTPase 1
MLILLCVLWQDLVRDVLRALFLTYKEFEGNIEEESELEILIDAQFNALQKAFRIPQKQSDEARLMVSKKLLTLFRTGKLGSFILDDLT